MWTDGHAQLLGLFPAEGDAPGVDFPGLKRVAGGRRFLSTQLGTSLMVVYRHDGALDAVTDEYRAALRTGGYRRVGTPGKGEALYAFSYERAGRHVVLTVQGGKGNPVMATLVLQP
jgi:hypothetical protein